MHKLIGPAPILVAHRGYSGKYPENTLKSYAGAYEQGARHMELDLQLSSDLVPIVHHDASLLRMAGVDRDIRDTPAAHIKTLRASYPTRFGSRFKDNKFTSFKKYCKWLKRHPDVTTFVEIKQESIDRFGLEVVVDQAHKRILRTGVERQSVWISFNPGVIEYARKISAMPSGWVLPEWSSASEATLRQLKPDYLFCDKLLLPPDDADIWQGDWQWAIYNLDDVVSAKAMANRGMPILETNQIGSLMSDNELSNRV